MATKENIFHFKSIVSKVHYLERDGFFYFMETEIWKDIIGYEGMYQVSNLGRIKSLSRKTPGKRSKITNERILKQGYTNDGYELCVLCLNCVNKTYSIHRLVASAFVTKTDILKIEVNHINGIRSDNRACNLEYVSHRENSFHATMRRHSHIKCNGVSVLGKKYPNRWLARTTINRKPVYIGTYDSEQEAINAKIEFCKANNIFSKYINR